MTGSIASRAATIQRCARSLPRSAARGSDAAGSAAVETLAEAEALLAGVEASEGTDDASAGTDDASERERDASRDASASASVERPSSLAARRAARDAALSGPLKPSTVSPARAASATAAAWSAIDELLHRHHHSPRGRIRLLRVARTLADLDDRDRIEDHDVLQAGALRHG